MNTAGQINSQPNLFKRIVMWKLHPDVFPVVALVPILGPLHIILGYQIVIIVAKVELLATLFGWLITPVFWAAAFVIGQVGLKDSSGIGVLVVVCYGAVTLFFNGLIWYFSQNRLRTYSRRTFYAHLFLFLTLIGLILLIPLIP